MDFDIIQRIELLETIVSDMESKVEELCSRPRMPFTKNAFSGDVLTLVLDAGGNLIPSWEPPPP